MSHVKVRRRAIIASFVLVIVSITAPDALAEGWKAGVATAKITPAEPMWMSGYASRDRPAEGTLHDIWAKALVLEDSAGHRAAIVTLDLVGIGRELALDIRSQLAERYHLTNDQVAFCISHTHTGPVVGGNLAAMYFLDEAQQKLVDDYAETLKSTVVDLVGAAIADSEPAELHWGCGHASFAVNRRNNREADVPELRAARRLNGPIDHDVPVLAVSTPKGELKTVVFGYACHATTLSFFQWSGDYPGFAQIHLQEKYPGTVAMFFAGCGADQNPLPRRQVEQADEYGRRLAEAVTRVLDAPMVPVGDASYLATSYHEIDLPLDKLPTREQLKKEAASENRYVASRAQRLLAGIDAGTPLSPTYPYPVQVWRIGSDLIWVTLGGEVVVDYSNRLKGELGPKTTWVAGYSNDVMAYIPSRRVLNEGGYEGGGAMVYYGLPTVWAPQVEQMIVGEVHRQVEKVRAAAAE